MLRRGSTKVVVIVIACVLGVMALGCGLVVLAIVLPAVSAVNKQANLAKDLEQTRGMGNAMTLYYKKYGHFPCLIDLKAPTTKSITQARLEAGKPHCLALKLLVNEGYVEDCKMFFSPRGDAPDPATLNAMQRDLDPRSDPVWAGTYAYDPGHNPNHGAVPFFGSSPSVLKGTDFQESVAHVLTCEQVAKEIELDPSGKYIFLNHPVNVPVSSGDDLYADDTATFGWRDAYMKCDVPAKLP